MFSAAIVAVALLAMLAFPLYFLRSFAYAGIGVVVIAMLAVGGHPARGAGAARPRASTPGGCAATGRLRAASERSPASGAGWPSAVMRRPVLAALPVVARAGRAGRPVRCTSASARPTTGCCRRRRTSRQVGDVLRTELRRQLRRAALDVLLTGDARRRRRCGPTPASCRRLPASPRCTRRRRRSTRAAAGRAARRRSQFVAAGVRGDAGAGPADGARRRPRTWSGDPRRHQRHRRTTSLVGGAPAVLVDAKASIAQRPPARRRPGSRSSTFVLLFLFTGGAAGPGQGAGAQRAAASARCSA